MHEGLGDVRALGEVYVRLVQVFALLPVLLWDFWGRYGVVKVHLRCAHVHAVL